MSTLDVTNLKSKVALTPTKFYDKDDVEIGTLCRAWVNFNGIGTVAIRGSFNVSGVTRNSTGNYTINFTNAMPDANYSVGGLSHSNGVHDGSYLNVLAVIEYATTSVRVRHRGSGPHGTVTDQEYVNVQVFR